MVLKQQLGDKTHVVLGHSLLCFFPFSWIHLKTEVAFGDVPIPLYFANPALGVNYLVWWFAPALAINRVLVSNYSF